MVVIRNTNDEKLKNTDEIKEVYEKP